MFPYPKSAMLIAFVAVNAGAHHFVSQVLAPRTAPEIYTADQALLLAGITTSLMLGASVMAIRNLEAKVAQQNMMIDEQLTLINRFAGKLWKAEGASHQQDTP